MLAYLVKRTAEYWHCLQCGHEWPRDARRTATEPVKCANRSCRNPFKWRQVPRAKPSER